MRRGRHAHTPPIPDECQAALDYLWDRIGSLAKIGYASGERKFYIWFKDWPGSNDAVLTCGPMRKLTDEDVARYDREMCQRWGYPQHCNHKKR